MFDLMGESDGMIWAACSKFRDLNRCETNALSNSGMGQNRYTIQCEASTINHSYWSYVHQLSYRTGQFVLPYLEGMNILDCPVRAPCLKIGSMTGLLNGIFVIPVVPHKAVAEVSKMENL